MQRLKSKRVIVYSQLDCPACQWARDYLSRRAVAFEVRDITTDGEALEQLLTRYQSRSTPTIIVGDQIMIGFDPQRLDAMLAASEDPGED